MFGPETFIVRVADDAMAPRVCAGDYIWIDPDEPIADGRLVAVRDPDRGGETVVRCFVERDGRRTVCALDARCPECAVDDADIQGVVVYVAQAV
ncbi:MAG: S24 family peptidase [Acidobacteriota bacterium]|nr:S24 family peptidase [Acidobacteriota bacterium]